jgi:hypothetical protein
MDEWVGLLRKNVDKNTKNTKVKWGHYFYKSVNATRLFNK